MYSLRAWSKTRPVGFTEPVSLHISAIYLHRPHFPGKHSFMTFQWSGNWVKWRRTGGGEREMSGLSQATRVLRDRVYTTIAYGWWLTAVRPCFTLKQLYVHAVTEPDFPSFGSLVCLPCRLFQWGLKPHEVLASQEVNLLILDEPLKNGRFHHGLWLNYKRGWGNFLQMNPRGVGFHAFQWKSRSGVSTRATVFCCECLWVPLTMIRSTPCIGRIGWHW